MIYKPRKHQSEAMEFFRKNPYIGTFLWHEMGLGKSLSSLWLAREHLANLRKKGVMAPKFIIILPKSAVPTWKVECHKQTPDIYKDMIVYPYSQLSKATNMLRYVDVRMIIFDESHYLKSPETDRAKVLCNFLVALGTQGGRFEHGKLIMLTGTPMPNSAAELYTTWALCSTTNIVDSAERVLDLKRFENWKKLYTNKKTKTWKKKYGREQSGSSYEGVANEDKLMEVMKPLTHYRRSEDCIDLPDKEEIHINLGLDDDALLKDANIEEPEAYMALLERLSRAKTPYLLNWVADFLTTGSSQLVVFSNYVEPLRNLRDKHPKDVVLITGAESGGERAVNLKKFQDGKVRVIAMSFRAGSESLNLQNAHISLYHGWFWHDAGIKQAMARTRRSGQTKRTLHYFLTSGENDSRLLSMIRRKEEATSTVEALMLSNSKLGLDSFI